MGDRVEHKVKKTFVLISNRVVLVRDVGIVAKE